MKYNITKGKKFGGEERTQHNYNLFEIHHLLKQLDNRTMRRVRMAHYAFVILSSSMDVSNNQCTYVRKTVFEATGLMHCKHA